MHQLPTRRTGGLEEIAGRALTVNSASSRTVHSGGTGHRLSWPVVPRRTRPSTRRPRAIPRCGKFETVLQNSRSRLSLNCDFSGSLDAAWEPGLTSAMSRQSPSRSQSLPAPETRPVRARSAPAIAGPRTSRSPLARPAPRQSETRRRLPRSRCRRGR